MEINFLLVAGLISLGVVLGSIVSLITNKFDKPKPSGRPSDITMLKTRLRAVWSLLWSKQFHVVTETVTAAQITNRKFVAFVEHRVRELVEEGQDKDGSLDRVRELLGNKRKKEADRWSVKGGKKDE